MDGQNLLGRFWSSPSPYPSCVGPLSTSMPPSRNLGSKESFFEGGASKSDDERGGVPKRGGWELITGAGGQDGICRGEKGLLPLPKGLLPLPEASQGEKEDLKEVDNVV